MFEVSVEEVFSASHRLRLSGGRLESPHGHDWRVTATFAGPELNDAGLLVDFDLARKKLREVVAALHHTDLNGCPAMMGLNPSAEHVAKVIYDLVCHDRTLGKALHRVRVTEAPGCSATYVATGGRAL